ncbi:MAG TPA: glutaminyl-peptide cyclotransferase [Terriglobia bacterium]|nr:glutaminyl-peptide cyclotransferase [Terriglobia bacterium]
MKRTQCSAVVRYFASCVALYIVGAGIALAADGYRVLHAYPHDPRAFTQGLVYVDGYLYESTGLNGQSTLRKEDLETGRVLKEARLPSRYFGEGLTNWGNTLIQLTWLSHVAFVYDRATFKLLRALHCPWEGWGLTQDRKHLILSNGSSTLYFLNPQTLAEVRSIHVTDHGAPVKELNELEYIHGEIYANVWMKNKIARISPLSGNVLRWINLTGVLPQIWIRSPEAVLNGIAYDAAHKRLFVTGKLWPRLFEIQVVPGGGFKSQPRLPAP